MSMEATEVEGLSSKGMLQEDLASPSGLADAVEAESTDLLSPDMNEVPSASEVDVRPEGHNSPPVPSAASPVADSFDADGLQESVIEARAPDATDTHPAEADDARHDSGSPPEPAADAEGSQNHDYQRSPAEFSPAKHTGLGGRQAPECPVPVSYDYDPNYWVCLDAPQSYLSSLPPGSRLFIGNLASEHTDKIQMAHVFAKYGNIAEISLKESYGFVQFDNPEACRRAISAEQGRVIAGMMIDLKSSREKYPGRKNDDFAGFAGRKFDRDSRGAESNGRRMNRGGSAKDKNRPSAKSRREDRFLGMNPEGRNRSSMWRNRYNKVGVPSYDNRANMPRGPPNFPHGDNHPLNKNFVMHDSEVDVPGVRNSRMEYYDNWNPPMPGSLPQPGCFYGGSEPGPGPPPQSIADNLYPRIGVVLPSTGTLALPTRRGASVPECQIVVFRGASRSFVFHVKDVVRRGNFVLDIIHLSTKIPVRDVIHKMATEGVLGLILIQWRCARDRLVTLHTFINGSKTKEYDGISVEAATYIMQKERSQSSQIPGAPAYVCRTRPQMKFKPEPPEPLHDDNRQAELGKNLGLISNLSSILMSINEMRAGSTDGKNSLLDLLKDIQRKRQYETQGIPADIPNSGLGFNPNDLQNLHLNKNLIDADAARNPLLQNELQLLSSSAQARAQTDPSNANIDALRLSYALIQALNAQGDRPNNLPSDQSLIHGQPAQRGASSLYSDAIGPQLRAPAPIPNLNNVANTAIHTPPVQQPIPPNYRPNDHFEGPGGAPQVLNPQIPQPGQPQAANPPQGSVVSVLERLKKLYQTQTQSKETRAFM